MGIYTYCIIIYAYIQSSSILRTQTNTIYTPASTVIPKWNFITIIL